MCRAWKRNALLTTEADAQLSSPQRHPRPACAPALAGARAVRVLEMNRPSNEERLTSLEAHQEHAATKEDLAKLETSLVDRIGKSETSLTRLVVGVAIAVVAALGGIVVAVEKLL